MTTPNLKFISYLGGSGGDWFATSLNGYKLHLDGQLQNVAFTLKPHEQQIQDGTVNLDQLLTTFCDEYITTHLFDYLRHRNFSVISIVIDSPDIQSKIILRQMSLQRLGIAVNVNETFFKLIKNLCLRNKFEQAANLWFIKAKDTWQDKMKQRLNTPGCQINFNQLFTGQFVEDIKCQGWNYNTDLLQENHRIWLEKNLNFSIDSTIQQMCKKLKTMDWNQTSGTIHCLSGPNKN